MAEGPVAISCPMRTAKMDTTLMEPKARFARFYMQRVGWGWHATSWIANEWYMYLVRC